MLNQIEINAEINANGTAPVLKATDTGQINVMIKQVGKRPYTISLETMLNVFAVDEIKAGFEGDYNGQWFTLQSLDGNAVYNWRYALVNILHLKVAA